MSIHQGAGPPEVLHGHRRQEIVQSLLADIGYGRLRAGVHLVTQDLAERFGVSHTPVREALITLAGMGLIELLPNRGAVVKRLAAAEIREICAVRRLLECAAVRRACGRIDREALRVLTAELRDLLAGAPAVPESVARARDLDSRLHDQIAASCGNAFLAAELARMAMLFRAVRDLAWDMDQTRGDYHRLTEEAREHLAILEALQAGDRRAAVRAMARHIASGYRYWSRAITRCHARDSRVALQPDPKPTSNGSSHP